MSLVQYTINFSKSNNKGKVHKYWIAILHQLSQEWGVSSDPCNKYLVYPFDDVDDFCKEDFIENIYHNCNFDCKVVEVKYADSHSEFNRLNKLMDSKVKKLNDDLRRNGKYYPDKRDKLK